MKYLLFLVLLIFNLKLYSQKYLDLSGYISFWLKNDNNDSLPYPLLKNIPVNIKLKITDKPQTFNYEKYSYFLENPYKINLEVKFYSIYPYSGDKYFVVQVKSRGDINLICNGCFNELDFVPFPVMTCGQYIDDENIVGITLSRLAQ